VKAPFWKQKRRVFLRVFLFFRRKGRALLRSVPEAGVLVALQAAVFS